MRTSGSVNYKWWQLTLPSALKVVLILFHHGSSSHEK